MTLSYMVAWSACASMVAAILIFVKYLFREQLSARWHLNIWGIFYIIIIVPPSYLWKKISGLGFSMFDIINPMAVTESVNHQLQQIQSSNVLLQYITEGSLLNPVRLQWAGSADASFPIPAFAGNAPFEYANQKFYFYIYAIIVILIIIYYIAAGIRLKYQLTKEKSADAAILRQIKYLKSEMNIRRKIKVVLTNRHESPFVCGYLFPILAIPYKYRDSEDYPLDDKILIHELIHIKYHHILLNYFLTLLRAIHFFNPFLWIVFRKIQNDCELRCDEHLLKRYYPKEHHSYGTLLLTCAVSKESFIAGTSCLSNSQKNILLRIKRIRGFVRLSEASTAIAFILTIFIGLYCLSAPVSGKPLDKMDNGFGFGVEVFQYNVQQAETYTLSSPIETAYAYGLSMVRYPMGFEWLVMSDDDRQYRLDHMYDMNPYGNYIENGTSGRINRFEEAVSRLENVVEIDINNVYEGLFTIYNLCRLEDGTYQGIVRFWCAASEDYISLSPDAYFNSRYPEVDYLYLEDHVIHIKKTDSGRFYAELVDFRNSLVPVEKLDHHPLPYYAVRWQDTSGEEVAISYAYPCYEAPMGEFSSNWAEPNICYEVTSRIASKEDTFHIIQTEHMPLKKYPRNFSRPSLIDEDHSWDLIEVYGAALQ